MALLPPSYMKALVSLGTLDNGSFIHIGTGFIYCHTVSKHKVSNSYLPFLITNKHVVDAGITHVRFDQPISDILKIEPITLHAKGNWVFHSVADVAALVIDPTGILMHERYTDGRLFIGDICTPTNTELFSITEGTGVFLLGYPLGLIGVNNNYPIVRFGIISRIQDYLTGKETTFLIDAHAFPGNSGGPVVVQPTAGTIDGTTAVKYALLIGMVSGYISDIKMNDNTGLSIIVPIDMIKETLENAISQLK